MNEKISYSAYQIANNFDAHRKGLPDEFQDWAAEIARDLRQLAAAQLAPAGMVLVPREPTAAMLKVAAHEGGGCTLGQGDGEYYPSFDDPMTRRVWAAMLAAVPAAQVASPLSHPLAPEGGTYSAAPAVVVDEAMKARALEAFRRCPVFCDLTKMEAALSAALTQGNTHA